MEQNSNAIPCLDLLERQPFVDRLKYIVELLSKGKKNACFAINGEWGSGKSFVLDMFEKDIAQLKTANGSNYRYMLFRYNCWQYDYYDEPLIAIVAAMQDYVAEENNYGMTDETKAKLVEAAKSVATSFVSSFSEQIKTKLGFDLIALVKHGIEGIEVGEKTWTQDHLYDPYFEFKKIISVLREKVAEFAQERTIVFVVDELDRCLPEYAVKVLERLHHIFDDIDNVQIILAIDKEQLSYTVQSIFGAGTSAKQYLAKFIDFELNLVRGAVQDNLRMLYPHYFECFLNDTIRSYEVDEFYKQILQDIDIRACKALVEKSYLCHQMLNTKPLDSVFLCIELFLSLLKHFELDTEKAKEKFNLHYLFSSAELFHYSSSKATGLRKFAEQYMRQPAHSDDYIIESRGPRYGVYCGDLYGIVLGCYRKIIGFDNDYWQSSAFSLIPFKNQQDINSYCEKFWELLGIIN